MVEEPAKVRERIADLPAAIRLRYGKFRYYTGGNLPSDTNYGRDPWRDIETPVAEICGPVSVAVANHHGYFNADGAEYAHALRPQVVIIPTWDSAHPTLNSLATIFSKAIYPGNRDIFATLVKEENHIANKKTDDLKSRNGTSSYASTRADRPFVCARPFQQG